MEEAKAAVMVEEATVVVTVVVTVEMRGRRARPRSYGRVATRAGTRAAALCGAVFLAAESEIFAGFSVFPTAGKVARR